MALSSHVAALCALCCCFTISCASGNPVPPKELTGHGGSTAPPPSSTTVTAEDLERAGDDAIVKALSNKVPGVWVGITAEGNLAVRIRGTNSIAANTEPLYVIDGLAVQPGPGGALLGINPHDIASIEVLKDAASLSFYGVRAANGVIIVTTKHAN
jgi:TonB-dependent SusC/RagA subfamily outer membrane receptor